MAQEYKNRCPHDPMELQAAIEVFVSAAPKKGIFIPPQDGVKILESSELISISRGVPSEVLSSAVENGEVGRLTEEYRTTFLQFMQQVPLDPDLCQQVESAKNQVIKYQIFAPSVQELMQTVNPYADPTSSEIQGHPQYIGNGEEGTVFRIEVEGRPYAAKFYRSSSPQQGIEGLIRASGIPGIVDLVGYSYPEKLLITEFVRGTSMDKFAPDEIPEFTDEEILELVNTLVIAKERGIRVNVSPDDIVYVKHEGFKILECRRESPYNIALPHQITSIASILASPYYGYDVDEVSYAKNRAKAIIRILELIQEHYDDLFEEIVAAQKRAVNSYFVYAPPAAIGPLANYDDELRELKNQLEGLGLEQELFAGIGSISK